MCIGKRKRREYIVMFRVQHTRKKPEWNITSKAHRQASTHANVLFKPVIYLGEAV